MERKKLISLLIFSAVIFFCNYLFGYYYLPKFYHKYSIPDEIALGVVCNPGGDYSSKDLFYEIVRHLKKNGEIIEEETILEGGICGKSDKEQIVKDGFKLETFTGDSIEYKLKVYSIDDSGEKYYEEDLYQSLKINPVYTGKYDGTLYISSKNLGVNFIDLTVNGALIISQTKASFKTTKVKGELKIFSNCDISDSSFLVNGNSVILNSKFNGSLSVTKSISINNSEISGGDIYVEKGNVKITNSNIKVNIHANKDSSICSISYSNGKSVDTCKKIIITKSKDFHITAQQADTIIDNENIWIALYSKPSLIENNINSNIFFKKITPEPNKPIKITNNKNTSIEITYKDGINYEEFNDFNKKYENYTPVVDGGFTIINNDNVNLSIKAILKNSLITDNNFLEFKAGLGDKSVFINNKVQKDLKLYDIFVVEFGYSTESSTLKYLKDINISKNYPPLVKGNTIGDRLICGGCYKYVIEENEIGSSFLINESTGIKFVNNKVGFPIDAPKHQFSLYILDSLNLFNSKRNWEIRDNIFVNKYRSYKVYFSTYPSCENINLVMYNNAFFYKQGEPINSSYMLEKCPDSFKYSLPSPQIGPNIVGGKMKGGNYYELFPCEDKDKDGICDAPYKLDDNTIIDKYPLFKYAGMSISKGPKNPYKEEWDKKNPMFVMNLKIDNSVLSKGDGTIKSITINYKGEGSVNDIETVSMYYDESCTGKKGESFGEKKFIGNKVTFEINKILKKGESSCFMIYYKIKDVEVKTSKYCSCALYGAEVKGEEIEAEIEGDNLPVSGKLTSSVNANYPGIDYVDENQKKILGQLKKRYPKALEVKIDTNLVHKECYDNGEWEAVYSISKEDVPYGAKGYFIEGGGKKGEEIKVKFDSNGIAKSYVTIGDKKGIYKVHVKPKPSTSNPYICPSGDYAPELIFEINGGDIKLKAKYDGTGEGDELIGTFISTQEVNNEFEIEKDFPEEFKGIKIKSVTYTPSWGGESKTINESPFKVEYNMGDLKQGSSMKVMAMLENGDVMEKDYIFKVIEIPEWVETFNGKPYTGIEWGFNEEGARYEVNLTYPNEGIKWFDPIPDWVGILGGEENEEEFSVTAQAAYHIDETASFAGISKYKGKILDKEVEAGGEIRIFLDKEFKIKKDPAGYAKLSGSVCFETEKKKLAEKTIVVYGVPITVVVEAGGILKILADGKVVFTKELKIKEGTFIPGIEVSLILDASASALKGGAKLGLRSIPTVLMQLKLKYTTSEDKLEAEKFGLKVSVTVQVYGSLFWGKLSKDPIGEAIYGPWIYGDNIGSASYISKSMLSIAKSSENEKLYSTGSVDINGNGEVIKVYTVDKGGVNPEVYFETGNKEGYITSNEKWEIDPDVAWIGESKAIAVWTSNDGDKNIDNLTEALNYQDIAYSMYNGGSWSDEKLLIDDEYRDGMAKVGADNETGKALVVWIHNKSQEVQEDGVNLELMYAFYNGENFSEAKILEGTEGESLDYEADVAGIGEGKFMVVWIHDEDGKLYKKLEKIKKGTDVDDNNTDCNVYYAIYDSNADNWIEKGKVTVANNATEESPSIVSDGKDIVVSWIEKGTDGNDRLYLAKYNEGSWLISKLDETSGKLESPNVNIEGEIAKVVYRKVLGKNEGIYIAEKNIGDIGKSSVNVKKLSGSKGLWLRCKVIGEEIVALSTDVNSGQIKEFSKPENLKGKILSDNITLEKYDNSSGKYKGIMVKVPVEVNNEGNYRVRGIYESVNGIKIEALSDKKVLNGEGVFELIFDGKMLNELKVDKESFKLNRVELLYYNPDEVILSSSKEFSGSLIFSSEEFIKRKARFSKEKYEGGNIEIEVEDEEASNVNVYIENDNFEGKEINLIKEGKIFKASVSPADIGITESGILRLIYVDKEGYIWRDSCLWSIKPPEVYELNIIIDNKTGGNKVVGEEVGIDCPEDCYESIVSGSEVTLEAVVDNGSVFIGWEGVNCDNSSLECSFIMDNNTEIKAYFKDKEPEYIDDITGEIEEEGKKVKRTMNLKSGWELVSVPVEGEFSTGEKFKSSSTIWGWSGNSWEVWSGNANIINLLNQYKITILSKLEVGKGYWLNNKDEYTEEFDGLSYGKDKINLSNGWNLVGCGVKLKSSEFTEAKTLWQWSGNNWKVWSPQDSIKTLLNQYKIEIADEIKAGEGFWINK